ncbi:hypothetical protein [Micromonospora sp. 067-2]|uniref:hypothetical protein n=1 Tax=Micromonospora sp. 067-2 TaxID=2789270 RepID=UPI0039796FD8
MRRDELAGAVRDTLSHQVAVARPLSADPAGQAIRRAKRIRRRRTAAGLALAAVATVLVSTGVARFGDGSGRQGEPIVVIGDPGRSALSTPSPAASAAPPTPGTPVDVLAGATLIGVNGVRLDLPGVGPAERVHLLPGGGGWLVVGAPTAAGRSLWVAQRDGLVQVLLAGAGPIVVAPDGRQVAWRDGTGLLAAAVIGTQLIGLVRIPVPSDAEPVRFVGDNVLVRLDPDGAGHSLWRPGGELGTGTDRSTLNVYGTLPDGRLLGQVTTADQVKTCLAVLDPKRELKPVRTGCGPELSQDGTGGVSADGRWLLVNGGAGKARKSLLVDLRKLGAGLTAVPAGPPMTGEIAWTTDSDATYVDDAGELVRVNVDRVRAGKWAEPVSVPGVRPSDRLVLVTS